MSDLWHDADVEGCARCEGDHPGAVFVKFTRPVRVGQPVEFTHYAICPDTGEPILMAVVDGHRFDEAAT